MKLAEPKDDAMRVWDGTVHFVEPPARCEFLERVSRLGLIAILAVLALQHFHFLPLP